MDYFVRNKFIIFLVVMCSLLFVSCGSNVEEKIQGIKLDKGAIIQNDSGELSNFNLLNGSYSKVDNNDIVGLYNSESGNYISIKDGEYLYYHDGTQKKLDYISSDATSLKLSKKDSYISYFTKDDGIFELKLNSLKDNKEVEFNSSVSISSNYMDWLDDENIIYYGISDEKVNGIFIYNVKEKKESLFYKLDNGIIQYLKTVEKGVVCIQETIDNQRILRIIDDGGDNVSVISKEIMQIKDIQCVGNDYYFIGKVVGGIESIYKISDNRMKRVIFDFPAVIDVEKGLSKDDDDNVLFIGKSSSSSGEEVYKVTSKGSISRIKDSAKEYSFVSFQ